MLLVLGLGSLALGYGQASAAYVQKTCTPDGGDHRAYARLHTDGQEIYGYQIKYVRIDPNSWAIGNRNNEFVFKGPLAAPHWASPDSGAPGVWINRDAMPAVSIGQGRLEIDAIFDRPNTGDPRCTMIWLL
jgi:hypothetical protein